MKHQTKLSREQQQQLSAEQRARQQTAREFATVEEVLRHDAAGTTVPPGIEQRLRESVGRAGAQPRSWWRNLFRK